MSDLKKIPNDFGVELEKVFGRIGARYFKEVVDAINTKIDEITAATAGNLAVINADGRLADSGIQPLQGDSDDLTASRLAYVDPTLSIRSVLDFTAWVAVNLGLTVSDDGDGSITLSVKQQSHVTDASTSHSLSGSDHVDLSGLESALNSLGTKINEILSALESAEILSDS